MKLFINTGATGQDWYGLIKIEELLDSKLKLSIPNWLENQSKHECIKFIIHGINEDSLKKDILLENISLKRLGKKAYEILPSKSKKESYMYALLRSTEAIPDDIFIPLTMKEKVSVVRRIQFVDDEVDFGGFLSNIYLIKIKLEIGESLPLYLSYKGANVLAGHYVFFRPDWNGGKYDVSKKLETYILLNDKNKEEYISLSKLCE